jgi:hypothetical protein
MTDLNGIFESGYQRLFKRAPANRDLDLLLDKALKQPEVTLQEVVTRLTSRAVMSMTVPRVPSRGIRIEGLDGERALTLSNADLTRALQQSAIYSSQISVHHNDSGWFDDYEEGSAPPLMAARSGLSKTGRMALQREKSMSILSPSRLKSVAFMSNELEEADGKSLSSSRLKPQKSPLSFSIYSQGAKGRQRHHSSFQAALSPFAMLQNYHDAEKTEAVQLANVVMENLVLRLPSVTKSSSLAAKSPRRSNVLLSSKSFVMPDIPSRSPLSITKSFTSSSRPKSFVSALKKDLGDEPSSDSVPTPVDLRSPRSEATLLPCYPSHIGLSVDNCERNEIEDAPAPCLSPATSLPGGLSLLPAPSDLDASNAKSATVKRHEQKLLPVSNPTLSSVLSMVKDLSLASSQVRERAREIDSCRERIDAFIKQLEARRQATGIDQEIVPDVGEVTLTQAVRGLGRSHLSLLRLPIPHVKSILAQRSLAKSKSKLASLMLSRARSQASEPALQHDTPGARCSEEETLDLEDALLERSKSYSHAFSTMLGRSKCTRKLP